MLSIKDFSEMCRLSPQTLRFYHAEGLLIPAEVDERTGYRGYTFDQIETAMFVMALRGTGMSVKLVRRALDAPDTAAELLREHVEELRLRREAEDEAITTARELLSTRPEVRRVRTPEHLVVAAIAPDLSERAPGTDEVWGATIASITATARELTHLVESRGGRVTGPPWASMATETEEQRRRLHTEEGPPWLVQVPVEASAAALAALDGSAETRTSAAGEELSVFLPGAQSMAKYGTALSLMTAHSVEDMFIDVSTMRLVFHENGIETAARLRPLAEGPDQEVPA
ncbi:MerR family transcriptional regulator [Nocardiopsis sp. N85]|uniref:MerR family transcriptional regulator n=1 Tax=Nocardiopsis sp. N85 TaxID=3029400 RepID=UPI00237F11B9|nr:MerR family transcriptional regulator [Nocardiopsis sp. N85]MDE3723404.1 MerR family transcriptional regulator [Nocardiopsis sp. N85]